MRWRSRDYLAWVADQNCARCGQWGPGEVHHIKGWGHLSGAGMKADDLFVMPLCPDCHRWVHANPASSGPDQVLWMVHTIKAALDEGWEFSRGEK